MSAALKKLKTRLQERKIRNAGGSGGRRLQPNRRPRKPPLMLSRNKLNRLRSWRRD